MVDVFPNKCCESDKRFECLIYKYKSRNQKIGKVLCFMGDIFTNEVS